MPTSVEFERWAEKLTSREAATRALYASWLSCHVGPEQVGLVPALTRALVNNGEDLDLLVRRYCAMALRRIGPPAASALPALVETLECNFWPVRLAAIEAILAIDVAESIPTSTIVRAIEQTVRHDLQELQRGIAAMELRQFGPAAASAVPALIELLTSPSKWARVAAATALGCIGPGASAAIPALKLARGDAFEDVQEAALTALKQISKAFVVR